MPLEPILGQPGLFKDAETGQIVNVREFRNFTLTVDVSAGIGSHVNDGEFILIYGRYVRVDELHPDVQGKVLIDGKSVTDWCEISSFTLLNSESLLAARVSRMEVLFLKLLAWQKEKMPDAWEHPPGFGQLFKPLIFQKKQLLQVEFDRPLTAKAVFWGLRRTPP